MKIVINKCYGGFGLSTKAIKEYLKLKGKECFFYKHNGTDWNTFVKTNEDEKSICNHVFTKDYGEKFTGYEREDYFSYYDIDRTDPDLIKVVELLGDEANGRCAELRVIEIPDEISYEITEYDGIEQVEEIHQSWG